MAATTISDLPALLAVDGTEQVPVSAAGITRRVTTGQIAGIALATLPAFPYAPAAPPNWAGNPATVWAALDRLAAAVAGLLGGPVP